MSVQNEVFDLLNAITENKDRSNNVLENNIKDLKDIVKKHSLTKEQQDLFFEWCNIHVVNYSKLYRESIGGIYYDDFVNVMIKLAFLIDDKNEA